MVQELEGKVSGGELSNKKDDDLYRRIAEIETRIATGANATTTSTAIFGGFAEVNTQTAADWINRKLKELNLAQPISMYHKGDMFKGQIFAKFPSGEIVDKIAKKTEEG